MQDSFLQVFSVIHHFVRKRYLKPFWELRPHKETNFSQKMNRNHSVKKFIQQIMVCLQNRHLSPEFFYEFVSLVYMDVDTRYPRHCPRYFHSFKND